MVCSGLTDNLEAEVGGIALGMDMAIQYYNTQPPRTEYDNLYILSDCLSAIEIVINRHQTDFSQQIINRVQSFLTTLRGLQVKVTLIWIPGHCEIYYNDIADLWAKKAIHDADEIPTSAVF